MDKWLNKILEKKRKTKNKTMVKDYSNSATTSRKRTRK